MTTPAHSREAVVLVHGLWLGAWSLALLGRRLADAGFAVYRYGYATRRLDLRAGAARLSGYAAQVAAPTVHFVGHSLGGIVIRALFHHAPLERPGRIVTLGSPHAGSAPARRLARSAPGRWMLGRAVADLVADVPDRYARLPREVGVIRGSRPFGLGRLLVAFREPNDGVVSFTESRLPEAADTLTLPVSHTGLLVSRDVATSVALFLRTGRFRS